MPSKFPFQKTGWILSGMIRFVVTPFTTVALFYLVFHWWNSDALLSFTQYNLMIQASMLFVSYGAKDFLIREFSRNTNQIHSIFSQAFFARLLLFIPVVISFSFLVNDRNTSLILLCITLLRFVSTNTEPLIQYQRSYISAALCDFTYAATFLSLISYGHAMQMEFSALMYFWLMAEGIRALLIFMLYKRFFTRFDLSSVATFYSGALPFFITALAGLLFSRIDIYVLNFSKLESQAGHYNVLMSFLQNIALIFSLSLSPFAKNIFRLSEEKFQKVSKLFVAMALVLLIPACIILFFVLEIFFQWKINLLQLSLCYANVASFIFLLTKYYDFNRQGRQWLTAKLMLMCSIICFLLCIIFIPKYEWTAALAASTVSQWMFYFFSLFLVKKSVEENQ